MTDLTKGTERELTALADGSLAQGRRKAALERASGSRELEDALAEQRRTVELLTAVDVRAPTSVHRHVEQLLRPARQRRVAVRTRMGLAVTAAAALTATVVAIGVSGGGSQELSVRQAIALALSPATMGAPLERANSAQLTTAVGGVSFPYWKERFGWRSSGARTDKVAGRSVTTVFYSNAQGRRIGYAIVSGPAPQADGGRLADRWGVQYRVLAQDGATVITWRRGGHLCVVAGRKVSAHTLLSLASWGSERPHAA
jgi:hypothetical protein